MSKTIESLLKIVLAGIVAMIALSGFTIIYCNSGIHITNPSGATDYTWEPNQLKSTMTVGISWLHTGSNGFNNVSFLEKTLMNLLMGSSYMEAVNIDTNKNLGDLLNQMLPEHTYNIGISGHQIYNCVRNGIFR